MYLKDKVYLSLFGHYCVVLCLILTILFVYSNFCVTF